MPRGESEGVERAPVRLAACTAFLPEGIIFCWKFRYCRQKIKNKATPDGYARLPMQAHASRALLCACEIPARLFPNALPGGYCAILIRKWRIAARIRRGNPADSIP